MHAVRRIPLVNTPAGISIGTQPRGSTFHCRILPDTPEHFLHRLEPEGLQAVFRRARHYLCGIAGNPYLIDMLQIIPLRLPFCMGKAIEYIHTIPHQCKYNQQLGKQPAVTAALVPYLV